MRTENLLTTGLETRHLYSRETIHFILMAGADNCSRWGSDFSVQPGS